MVAYPPDAPWRQSGMFVEMHKGAQDRVEEPGSVAFRNPDGSQDVIVLNRTGHTVAFALAIAWGRLSCENPACAIQK